MDHGTVASPGCCDFDDHLELGRKLAAYTVGLECDTAGATTSEPAAPSPDDIPTLDSNL